MENKRILSSHINNNLKQHDKGIFVANRTTSEYMKGPWNHMCISNISPASSTYASEDNGYAKLSGFSFPPRLYVCSFCKREFRSAQALGGHMNVHRRDRAMLRQSPPASPSSPPEPGTYTCPLKTTVADSINLNLIPSPNPNLLYSSTWRIQNYNNYTTHPSAIPSPKPSPPSIIPSSSGVLVNETARWSVARPNPFTTSTFNKVPNILIDANYKVKEHWHNQEMNINKARQQGELLTLEFGSGVPRKEEVDLELRLGYSS